jgi:hypothetical protein
MKYKYFELRELTECFEGIRVACARVRMCVL